jgi:asparagine synthetase B (glutamine-hydrolysing)
MQLLLGVVGPDTRTARVFDRLCAHSARSNPGLEICAASAPNLRLGHRLRSFSFHDDPDADVTIALDGEVRAIEGRDTRQRGHGEDELATITDLYRRHGRGLWERLEGSFCLLIRDGREVRIGFDIAGTRAMYWWAADGMVAFHSHLVDLAGAHPGEPAVDPAGVAGYFAQSFFPLHATAFRGISVVGAGQVLEIDPDGDGWTAQAVDHFRYVPGDVRPDETLESLAGELNELLDQTISRSWRMADNPVVPLSGGVDSRYLAAALVRSAGDPSLVPTITWGQEPTRPDSDAVIAPRVAAALGAPHTWYEKLQPYATETLQRAIYLTSGEGDGALHYPRDHEFHEWLAAERGYRSLFRGDQLFGEAHPTLTMQGAFAVSGLSRFRLDPVYPSLLGRDVAAEMARAHDELLTRWSGSLVTTTPHNRLYELVYDAQIRRELFPYNRLKDLQFEVHTPMFDRAVIDWVRRLPERQRTKKRVLKLAMAQRFPEVASIPYATRNNLPDWDRLSVTDPSIASTLLELCRPPGWLDAIGARSNVIAGLEAMRATAERASAERAAALRTGAHATGNRGVRWPRGDAMQRFNVLLRNTARATPPGRYGRELTMQRRAVMNRTMYARLSRLAVIHELLGQAAARRADTTG